MRSLELREKRITHGFGCMSADRLSLHSVNSSSSTGGGLSLPPDSRSLNLDLQHQQQPSPASGRSAALR